MSRRTIVRLFFCYFVAAMGFAVFEAWQDPLWYWLFSHIGDASDREEKITKMTTNGGFTGKNRDDLTRSMKLSCAQAQRSNPLTPKIGLSEEKVLAYCDCYTAGMAAAITIEELRSIATTGKYPMSITDRATMLGNSCGQKVLITK